MTIDTKAEATQDTVKTPQATPLQQAGKIGLAIINPLSDLKILYNSGLKPALEKFRRLRETIRKQNAPQESLTWEQAVERSGQSVEQLARYYRRSRYVPWFAMMVSAGLFFILMLMLAIAGFDLPDTALGRFMFTEFGLAMICALGFKKVLGINFRLWQLMRRRVTVEEKGTFRDYQAENKMWLQLVTVKSPF